jgi:predicted dienelactone hydrolase
MRPLSLTACVVLASLSSAPACGSSGASVDVLPEGGKTTEPDSGRTDTGVVTGHDGGAADGHVGTTDGPTGSDAGSGSDTGHHDAAVGDAGNVPDPNLPGPYAYKELDDTIASVPGSSDTNLAVHCAYPTSGPTAGPYPVIVVAHGLDLAPSQYYGYLERLASFGYVALTVDFPSSLFAPSDPNNAHDLLAGLDWAATSSTVGSISDVAMSGMTGHSEGGKDALYAATLDPRVKASIVMDPVDSAGGMTCTAPACVTVASLMPSLHIPTGFLGETTDSTGGVGGMPCAPAAENFETFYAETLSPSLEVTVTGADHMEFLDDKATCGLVCSLCTAGTAANATVDDLAHAYVAAFYERYMRGNVGYDTYLTGAVAQARYVVTNEAAITSK